ncbi:MAG: hypothetical protein ACKOBW_04390, partial [Planctomycetota bacterium]
MSDSFNPYQVWLGLDQFHGPAPDHYQLFGLTGAETDTLTIAAAADRAIARVRSFRPGSQAAAWAALLDQLSAAKRCLTDPAARREYDVRRAESVAQSVAGVSGVPSSTGIQASAAPSTVDQSPVYAMPVGGPVMPAGCGVAMPGAGVAMPGAGVAMPGAGVAMPGAGVAMPGTGVAMPGAGVAMPGAGVAMPGAGVAMPGAGVAMPGAGVA